MQSSPMQDLSYLDQLYCVCLLQHTADRLLLALEPIVTRYTLMQMSPGASCASTKHNCNKRIRVLVGAHDTSEVRGIEAHNSRPCRALHAVCDIVTTTVVVTVIITVLPSR